MVDRGIEGPSSDANTVAVVLRGEELAGDWNHGLPVASIEVFKALADEGLRLQFISLDEAGETASFQRRIRSALGAAAGRAQFVHLEQLLVAPQANSYLAVYCTAHLEPARVRRIRDLLAPRGDVPVLLSHHGVSCAAQVTVESQAWQLVLGSWCPGDTLLCTTQSVAETWRSILRRTSEQLGPGSDQGTKVALEVVPLAVDTKRFRPRSRTQARRELAWREDGKLLLYLGRVDARTKADLQPMLGMFRDLSKQAIEPVRLVIAGQGDPRSFEVLRAYAKEVDIEQLVEFVPEVDTGRRELYLQACDIFLSPIDNPSENFGLTAVEAQACARPAVVSHWGGYIDVVEHGVTGISIPSTWTEFGQEFDRRVAVLDPLAAHAMFARAVAIDMDCCRMGLLALLCDDNLRERMGAAARERACRLYSRTAFANTWLRVARASALRAKARPRRVAPVVPLPLWHCFGHYASRKLLARDRLRITASGALVLGGSRAVAFAGTSASALRPEAVSALLWSVADAPSISVGAAIEGSRAAHSQDDGMLGVLWLLKQGYLVLCDDLVGSESSGPPALASSSGGCS